jgi:uncharacterized protein (DUF697 family)/GTP-binding protein EngB required for normal cell division
VALAAIGWLLVWFPPRVADAYRAARELHPVWGRVYLSVVGAISLALVSWIAWYSVRIWRAGRAKKRRDVRRATDPSRLSRSEQELELSENLSSGSRLAEALEVDSRLRREILGAVQLLERKREAQKLEIVAFGSISSGKSSLLNALAGREVFRTDVAGGTTPTRSDIPWPGRDRVVLADTPGLAEVGGEDRSRVAAEAARDADIVLFVVDGPLKEYEVELVRILGEMHKRMVVCLNKEDWFEEDDRRELTDQIAQQLSPWVQTRDILPVRAAPAPRRRVRVLSNGTETEETVDSGPEISRLAERLLGIVERDGRDLLLANLLVRSRGLVDQSQARILDSLDRAADDIIQRAMWAAGGAVAVSPLPLLDLAGGSAVTVKMVLDLARVYRQQIDAEAVVQLLAQLAKNLLAILGVTAAAPAVTLAVGSLIKTVPGVGTLAGGLMQGMVQALVTRWIGKVFVAYFRGGMQAPAGDLAELARAKWEEITRPQEIRKLVRLMKGKGQVDGH